MDVVRWEYEISTGCCSGDGFDEEKERLLKEA